MIFALIKFSFTKKINMKTKTIFTLLILMFLFGCDKIEESTQFETSLSVSQIINIDGNAANIKSKDLNDAVYSFSSSKELNLADNPDVGEFVEKVKWISVNSAKVNITGILSGQTIQTISVKIDGNEIYTASNIDTSGSLISDISSEELNVLASILAEKKKATISVSGTTDNADLSFTIEHVFETTIQAKLL